MLRKLIVAAAIVFAAAPGVAQSAMHFVSPGTITDGHYFVGPYQLTQNGVQQTAYCIDFFHAVNPPNDWTANVAVVTGNLSTTRLGSAVGAIDQYEKAAYLTTQFEGATNQQTVDIQHAIWRLFAPDAAFTGSGNGYVVNAGSDFYLALANSNYLTSGINFSNYVVITDVNVLNPNYPDQQTVQEYLGTVPEPTSLALFGTGLIGLVPLVRWRKKA
jgi:hypothetical protein